jgi:hypothetical protein
MYHSHSHNMSPACSSENSSCANSPYRDGLSSHSQYVRVNAEHIKENYMLKIKILDLETKVFNLEATVYELETSAANNRRDIDELFSRLTPTQDTKFKAFWLKFAAEKAATKKAAAEKVAAEKAAAEKVAAEKAAAEKVAAEKAAEAQVQLELEAAEKTAVEAQVQLELEAAEKAAAEAQVQLELEAVEKAAADKAAVEAQVQLELEAAEKAAAEAQVQLELEAVEKAAADKAAVEAQVQLELEAAEKAAADEAASLAAFRQDKAKKAENRRAAAEAATKRATVEQKNNCENDEILAQLCEQVVDLEDKKDFPLLGSGNWSSVARKAPVAPASAPAPAPVARSAPTASPASGEWLQLKEVLKGVLPKLSVTNFKGISPHSAIATQIWEKLKTNKSDTITFDDHSGIWLDNDHILIVKPFATDVQAHPIHPYIGKNFRGFTPKSGLKFIRNAIVNSGVYDKIRFYEEDKYKTLFILCKDPEANHRYMINMVNTGDNFFTKNFKN